MKTITTPPKKLPAAIAGAMNFKGFDDWFEIFEGGQQTDSQGRTREFTDAELDTVVASHEPAPLVVGHPKTNAPAYGWSSDLKRVGKKLYAKASDVAAEFEEAVKAKHFPKRSVSLEPDGSGGFKLRHIGFLGAAAPAVAGLKDIQFTNGSSSICNYEFQSFANEQISWNMRAVAQLFRSLKNWLIENSSSEDAERILPEWQMGEVEIKSDGLGDKTFSKQQEKKELKMDYSQEDLDAAVEAARKEEQQKQQEKITELQYKEQLSRSQIFVEQLKKDKKLLPAQTEGLAEFLAKLQAEESLFEFSASDESTVKKSQFDFMSDLLKSLNPQIVTGEDTREAHHDDSQDYVAPAGFNVSDDRRKLHASALEYSRKNSVSFIDAVSILENKE